MLRACHVACNIMQFATGNKRKHHADANQVSKLSTDHAAMLYKPQGEEIGRTCWQWPTICLECRSCKCCSSVSHSEHSTSAPGECSLSTILRCARDLTGSMLMRISGRCAHDPSAAPGPTDTGPKLAMGCSPVTPVGASQFTCPTVTWSGTQVQLATALLHSARHAGELNCIATCSVILTDET